MNDNFITGSGEDDWPPHDGGHGPADNAQAELAPTQPASPWIVTDGAGRVHDASPTALALLAANRSVLRRVQRRLHAPHQQGRLLTCLAQTIALGASALALPRDGRLPLTLRCEAKPHSVPPLRLHLTLRDPEVEYLDARLVQAMFDLTAAEARVAADLALGHSTAQIAVALRVQTNTVLTHIKKALTKTGTGRQAELVSLLLRSAALTSLTPEHLRPSGRHSPDKRGRP